MSYTEWVEVARNTVPNTQFVTSADWGPSRSTSTPDPTIKRHPTGPGSLKIVVNVNQAGVYVLNGTTAGNRTQIRPGKPFTGGLSIRPDAGSQGGYGLHVYEYDASGVLLTPVLTQPLVTSPAGSWTDLVHTFTPKTATSTIRFGVATPLKTIGQTFWMSEPFVDPSGSRDAKFFDGDTDRFEDTTRTRWLGAANASISVREQRSTIPIIPINSPTMVDTLYSDRTTTYRWEVLEHSNGIDHLVGVLDGVSEGSITWTQNVAVKGSGKAQVVDLDIAKAGMLRVSDLRLESIRLRPVCIIEGLPENPLGVFLVSAAKEAWNSTGRIWSVELLDRTTVPSQDKVEQSYAVAAGTPILQQVRTILASSGEYVAINESSTLATSGGMVWEAGTSKLKIINDLLDVAGYNALWTDGWGNFQMTPRVLPADRSVMYELLGFKRELRDGAASIYRPDWSLDRDSFDVPNKVLAVQAAGGEDDTALVGVWTNEDTLSPYSYQSRGRWIPHVIDGVETPEGTEAETLAFLQKRAQTTLVQMSAVQAQVKVEHLPIPVRVSDVVQFAHTKAGVDGRHVITHIELDTSPLGLMKSTLQEVISL